MNLPSLWLYVPRFTPEHVLRNVRNLVSIGSSRGSKDWVKSDSLLPNKVQRNSSSPEQSIETDSSHTYLVGRGVAIPEGGSVETHAMKGLSGGQHTEIEGFNAARAIIVQHSIERTEEQV